MSIVETIRAAFISDKKKVTLFVILLLALNLLLYIATVDYDFLKDDYRLILENPRIKDFDSFIHSIGSKFFAFPDYPYLHYWRPVSMFSFYLDYQIWGVNPSGYHLTNVLLNTLNGLLIFFIFLGVSNKPLFSFLTAGFFSIHPAHVEAVAWISGRTDLLGALFIFSAILFFIRFLQKRSWHAYFLTSLFFILALLSKENAVLFPLLAMALVLTLPLLRGQQMKLKHLWLTLPLWVVDVIYMFLHNHFSGVRDVLANFSFADVLTMIKTVGVYTKITLLPFFPTPYFSMQHFDRSPIEYLLFFTAALAILAWIIIKRDHYKGSLYSLLFFIFLLPVLDPEIVPSYPKIVIRFAYIPVVFAGVFFIETIGFLKQKRLKNIVIGSVAIIALSWVTLSVAYQDYFSHQANHYKRLAVHHPEDCSLLLPLALITAQEGRLDEALSQVDRALDVNHKDRWLDVTEMGGLLKANLLVITGKLTEGKSLAEKILARTGKDEMKYFGFLVLSKYHEKHGDLPAALAMLKKAGDAGKTADLHFRTAVIHAKMGKYLPALESVDKARRLNPAAKQYAELEQFLVQTKQKEVNRVPGE